MPYLPCFQQLPFTLGEEEEGAHEVLGLSLKGILTLKGDLKV